jgi:antitoxin component of RelBE/YafQ-DinJ toxin-antitoxin module
VRLTYNNDSVSVKYKQNKKKYMKNICKNINFANTQAMDILFSEIAYSCP